MVKFGKAQEIEIKPPNGIDIYGGVAGPSWRTFDYYTFGEFYFMRSDLAHYIYKELTHEMRAAIIDYKI